MGKMRVHEIAKELGLSSKDAMEKLNSMGVEVKSVLQSVDDSYLERMRRPARSAPARQERNTAPQREQGQRPPQRDQQQRDQSQRQERERRPEPRRENPQQGSRSDQRQQPRRPAEGGQRPAPQRRDNRSDRPQSDRPQQERSGDRNRRPREFSFEGRNENRGDTRPGEVRQHRPSGPRNDQQRPGTRRPGSDQRPDRRPGGSDQRGERRPGGRPDSGGPGARPPRDRDGGRPAGPGRRPGGPGSSPAAKPAPDISAKEELEIQRKKSNPQKDKERFVKKGEVQPKPKKAAGEKDINPQVFKKVANWDSDDVVVGRKGSGKGKKRRKERKRHVSTIESNKQIKIVVHEAISVADFAKALSRKATEIVAKLIEMGVMANINQVIDAETAELLAAEYGAAVEIRHLDHEHLLETQDDNPEDLAHRAPVVTIMGHVDHGKTSLLDTIRKTTVAEGEAGGITQHIGAYHVKLPDGRAVAFLDTPGHEAFTQMRARGAQVTDIVILVVAADDGVMPQTREAVDHSKAAGVPIIVAVNKIDKPGATPDRVRQELAELNLLPEDWGGQTIYCNVSAKEGMGIEELLEMVLLQAEMLELTANPDREMRGTVIESKLDKRRGAVSTILVQNGTLRKGDILLAGTCYGRVRAMFDEHGKPVKEAGPSVPVEVLGLSGVPDAGELAATVADEKTARQICTSREDKVKAVEQVDKSKMTLDDLFTQMQTGDLKELGVIIKADVHGSAEALAGSLEKLSNEKIRLKVLHKGAGGITETDVNLASASNAIIIGFNVRPESKALDLAMREGVDLHTYSIIYEAVDEVRKAMEGMLGKRTVEKVTGHVEVRDTFRVPKVGTVAGCYVTDGEITRNSFVRLLRDSVVVFEGKLTSLKRFKDDVRDVRQGYECGIGLENFDDIKEGDVMEVYVKEELQQTLDG